MAILVVLGCVGHIKVANCCCSDIFLNVGTSDDISLNAVFLSLPNLVHWTRKCFSSSTGPGDGVDPGDDEDGETVLVLGGIQYEQVLSNIGVTGLVQRPFSTPRK